MTFEREGSTSRLSFVKDTENDDKIRDQINDSVAAAEERFSAELIQCEQSVVTQLRAIVSDSSTPNNPSVSLPCHNHNHEDALDSGK
jgi:hypothetical protein